MLRRILDIPRENLLPELDATDALGAALHTVAHDIGAGIDADDYAFPIAERFVTKGAHGATSSMIVVKYITLSAHMEDISASLTGC